MECGINNATTVTSEFFATVVCCVTAVCDCGKADSATAVSGFNRQPLMQCVYDCVHLCALWEYG